MEKMVYDFLDKYVGGGVNVSGEGRIYDPYDFMPINVYFIYSDNGTRVIQIKYKDNQPPSIVCEKRLGDVVSNFFSIDSVSSHAYISLWIKERNDIKDLCDLRKLIVGEPSSM